MKRKREKTANLTALTGGSCGLVEVSTVRMGMKRGQGYREYECLAIVGLPSCCTPSPAALEMVESFLPAAQGKLTWLPFRI